MSREPRVLLESFSTREYTSSYSFSGFTGIVSATTTEEVLPALEKVEQAVNEGLHAVGFLSYEAATALGQGFPTREPGELPFVWFALYQRKHVSPSPDLSREPASPYEISGWEASIPQGEYEMQVHRIRELIAAGDVYQVNFTLRHNFRLNGDPFSYYRDLCRAQRAPFCAYIDTGRFQILSASPELFFDLRHGTLTTRPMKGTAPRGRWHAEDDAFREELKKSRKDRAENLMIVDLLRNDMGKVAVTGSVRAASLFDIETLDSVHQMTSTITAQYRPETGIVGLFRALFPSGSITGAPKKRSMEIIRETERSPRGVYTGCIGYISPNFEAVFNVAIRTVVVDTERGTGQLGTGSGITWDSSSAAEYEECILKAKFANRFRPHFQLVETLLYEEDIGYFLLERHMARLYRSCAYFGFTLRLGSVLDTLNLRARPLSGKHRVRLLVSHNGTFSVQTEPIPAPREDQLAIVALSRYPVDSRDPFLYHKTTNHRLYDEERHQRPDCTDIIFFNERNEVTEAGLHNIVVNLNGKMLTPPLTAGILPGTFREELLATQVVRERAISIDDLTKADDVFLINSVRKWRKARLVS